MNKKKEEILSSEVYELNVTFDDKTLKKVISWSIFVISATIFFIICKD